jgi:biopolymer transport protein ExbD
MIMRRIPIVESPAPMGEMNTTPLIDVMLVLLIMFIITIPLQTHAIKLDLPSGPPVPLPKPVVNELAITSAGSLLWNGVPMSTGEVEQELQLTAQMKPSPELHLRPDPVARYGVVDDVLAMIKRENVQKFGFVGNERYLKG